MQFTKMQGAGNDFIVINNIKEQVPVEKLGELASQVCKRRVSIGADGFMAIDKPEKGGDYLMRFYNSDGSLGEMCGNGARCAARYGYENGLAGEIQHIETTAGMVIGERISKREFKIRLNDVTVYKPDVKVTVCGKSFDLDYIELGNPGIPHVAVRIPGLSLDMQDEIREVGRQIRFWHEFPKGANVNFYDILGADESEDVIEMTFERGVEDFTLACGTGTGSVVAALTTKSRVSGKAVRVRVPGGVLTIDCNTETGELYLTGPTNIVATGQVTDEEISF